MRGDKISISSFIPTKKMKLEKRCSGRSANKEPTSKRAQQRVAKTASWKHLLFNYLLLLLLLLSFLPSVPLLNFTLIRNPPLFLSFSVIINRYLSPQHPSIPYHSPAHTHTHPHTPSPSLSILYTHVSIQCGCWRSETGQKR